MLILNDQGGGIMSVDENVVGTLRAEMHGHPPVIIKTYAPSANFCGAYDEADVSCTLATAYHYGSGGDAALIVIDTKAVYENQRSEVSLNDVSPPISTGGGRPGQGNPCVLVEYTTDSTGTPHAVCYAIEGNGSRPSHKGDGWRESDVMYTLNTTEIHGVCTSVDKQLVSAKDIAPALTATAYKDPTVICYGISSYDSNAMKSSNPHSGIYEASISRTLDTGGGNPACNQGGIVIVERSHE